MLVTARMRSAAMAVRVTLAVVLGGKAAALLWTAIHHGAGAGASHGPFMVAAAIEVAGAALMLVAPRRLLGHVLLAVSLLLGAVLHVLHGEAPPAAFLVYLASIALVALMRSEQAAVAGEAHG